MNPFLLDISSFICTQAGIPAGEVESLIAAPPDNRLGDYAFPCFVAAKTLKKAPQALAVEMAGKFQPTQHIESAVAAGPYLNFRVVREKFISWVLGEVTRAASYGSSDEGAGKTVVVDYSSPNIAKPLGVHHLRSAMIGNFIGNAYRKLGYPVVGINYLGDWGTGFGKLLAAYELWDGDLGVHDPVERLNDLYMRFCTEEKKDPSLTDRARKEFRLLEQGDPERRRLWGQFREISLKEFQQVYERLGVRFDVVTGESEVVGMIDEILLMLQQRGLTEISQDALIVNLEKFDMPPCLLKKGDESSLYATRDICTAIHRKRKYNFHKNIYVTDMGQSLHFKQFFRVLDLAGLEWVADCLHVPFGLMKFKGGKMSTREGNIVLLDDLLLKAGERVLEIIQEKNPDLPDKEEVAGKVGVGAVVFADLKARRIKDVQFDWDEALSFEGETGPYLQYTHARLASVMAKSGRDVPTEIDPKPLNLEEEFCVVRRIEQYPRVVKRALDDHEPSVVAGYLLELAAAFNAFYTQGNRDSSRRILVADSAATGARLLLTSCAAKVLKDGLNLLGIAAPERM